MNDLKFAFRQLLKNAGFGRRGEGLEARDERKATAKPPRRLRLVLLTRPSPLIPNPSSYE
jgi:hypothetical protein